MSFKVKEQPKKIYDAVTYQFSIEDENGQVYEIRKWEDTKVGGFYLWKEEENNWVDFYPDEELEDFINEDLEY